MKYYTTRLSIHSSTIHVNSKGQLTFWEFCRGIYIKRPNMAYGISDQNLGGVRWDIKWVGGGMCYGEMGYGEQKGTF